MTAALRKFFCGFAAICLEIGLMISLVSCVTVSVSEKKGKPSDGIQAGAPNSPFRQLDTSDADRAWQNSGNGNTIFYTSDCFGADPSIISIQQTVLQGLSDFTIESEQKVPFNSREALDTVATGTVDGIKVKIRFLVFKKNNCNFTINYFAIAKHFDKDFANYQQFLTKFRVP